MTHRAQPRMHRREFLRGAAASGVAALSAASCALSGASRQASAAREIMTVTGPIAARDLGFTLAHEHVVVDFIGADRVLPERLDAARAFETALPHLQRLKSRGCQSLIECTPAFIGRNVALLKRLSEASGVQIVTNTGYYGAVDNKYLPPHAFVESADDLAQRWLKEFAEGIDGTGIRPGFLKLGVGGGKLPPLHQKLLRAAARVHRAVGLPIAVHTGDGAAALDELRILGEENVPASALIWVHAQNDPGPIQIQAARAGAWISLDGVSQAPGNLARYRKFLLDLKHEGLLGRVLVSHDDGWSVEGRESAQPLKLFGNGNPEPYSTVFEKLVPLLRESGFAETDLATLFVANPAGAFAIRAMASTLSA